MDLSSFQSLVKQLTLLPQETEWVEWKHNNIDPEEIGRNISALSNAAALLSKQRAYIMWGIEDKTGRMLGTTFHPRDSRLGNQELESWLSV
ncbi:MAG: putative DNA binding domain-containing protein [Ignavibacteriae bacterium]|nr:putative DNA binding domain-containing protein [Ignavibacteriota bacterium]